MIAWIEGKLSRTKKLLDRKSKRLREAEEILRRVQLELGYGTKLYIDIARFLDQGDSK